MLLSVCIPTSITSFCGCLLFVVRQDFKGQLLAETLYFYIVILLGVRYRKGSSGGGGHEFAHTLELAEACVPIKLVHEALTHKQFYVDQVYTTAVPHLASGVRACVFILCQPVRCGLPPLEYCM